MNGLSQGMGFQEGYRELYRDLSSGMPSNGFFRHPANMPTKY